MTSAVHEIIADVFREQGLDRRMCYTHVVALPPDGATLEVQCSDAGVAGELRRRFSARGCAAPVLVLPLADVPPLMLVVSGVADVRREPSHRSELVSQMIYGDVVMPLKHQSEWVLARLDDGYIGWIRDWHLRSWSSGERDAFTARAFHRVRANHAEVLASPGPAGVPVAHLVAGSPVVAHLPPARGWVAVALPDGRPGFVRSALLEKTPGPRATPQRLARTGLRFQGIPYLWGGTTPNGFDCSGLIQRIFRLHGVLLPRDSDLQARVGRQREAQRPSEAEPGDLLFFGRSEDDITHVGLVLPDRTFLHAYGQVIVNSLDTDHPRYSAHLASLWRLTRSPLRTRRS